MRKPLLALLALTLAPTVGGPAYAESVPEQRCTLQSQIDYVTAVATVTVERNLYIGSVCPSDDTKINYGGDQYAVTFVGNTGTSSFGLKPGVSQAQYGDSPAWLTFSREKTWLDDEFGILPRLKVARWYFRAPHYREYGRLQATMRATATDSAGLVTTFGPKPIQAIAERLDVKYTQPGPVTMTVVVEDALGMVSTETQQLIVPGPPARPQTRQGTVFNTYRVRCKANVSDTGEPRQRPQPGYDDSYIFLRWTSDAGNEAQARVQVKGPKLFGTYKSRYGNRFFKSVRGPAKSGVYKARVQVWNQDGTSPWSKWKKLPTKTKKRCL